MKNYNKNATENEDCLQKCPKSEEKSPAKPLPALAIGKRHVYMYM